MTTNKTLPAPAWLNVDEVCPPELRAEALQLTSEIEALLPTIDDLARRAWNLTDAIEDAQPSGEGAPTDPNGRMIEIPWEWFGHAAGLYAVHEPLRQIEVLVRAGMGDAFRTDAPDWHPASKEEPDESD